VLTSSAGRREKMIGLRVGLFMGILSWLFGALVGSGLISYLWNMRYGEAFWPFGFLLGSFIGLVMGFVYAGLARHVTASLDCQDKRTFLSRLSADLLDMRYKLHTSAGDTHVFHHTSPGIMGQDAASITVVLKDDGRATVCGPAANIKKLIVRYGP
jgi:MFS family permease